MQSAGPLSVGFQAGSAMFEAVAQSKMLKASARVDEDNARSALLQGALNERDISRRGRAVQGEAIAALGASGGGVEGQSAQDLIYQNSFEIELAKLNERFSAASEARGYRMQASMHRAAAKNAIFGGILRAGGAAITGIVDARNQAAADAAYQRREDAYFPGAQQLPMPYSGNLRPGP